jgi:hypothetical protein
MSPTSHGLTALALALALGGCIPDVVAPPASAGASPVAAVARPPGVPGPLRRGVNVGNRLDAPTEGEWGVTLD